MLHPTRPWSRRAPQRRSRLKVKDVGRTRLSTTLSLLEQIQAAAVDSSADLGAALRHCKILASRIGSKLLGDWLLWESNGYPPEVDVPDYRTWGITVKGHFSGPFHSELRNAPVPRACIPEQYRDSVTVFRCRQSVASLEQMLAENSKGGSLSVTMGDLSLALGMDVYQGMNCLQAWGEFSRGSVVEALNTVRNRILDFALAIEREYPHAGERSESPSSVDQRKITQIFNTTITGGSMNLVGSAAHSAVSLTVGSGDMDAVRRQLEDLGATAAEIQSLQKALKEEPAPKVGAGFGPRVAEWLGHAIGKAASGAWKVGVDVASKVLTKMLCSYYGLPS
jgi:hypothetical protein